MRIVVAGLMSLLVQIGAIVGAQAVDSRYALVIGNADYERFDDLRNPVNDALAVAESLAPDGFALIGEEAHIDVTRREMLRLFRELEGAVGPEDTAVFFFAGHGVGGQQTNFLIPVDDRDIRTAVDVRDFAVDLASLMQRLEARGAGSNIFFLDACRDNPLPAEARGSLGARGLSRVQAPPETLVLYSAAPGQKAYDGSGELSYFSGALVDAIETPGLELTCRSIYLI